MNKLLKIYTDAPPIGKILIIVLLIAIMYVLYTVIKKAYTIATTPKSSLDAAKDELKDLSNSGAGAHYSDAQFKTWADALQQNWDGLGSGDDSAVQKVFSYLQNKADVLQLIKNFGIRKYTDDSLFMFNVKDFNLNEWINAEYDQADKDKIINGQLKAKQIDYAF